MADNRYGNGTPNVATVREFVAGYQAKNKETTASGAKTLAVGILTAAVVSLYGRRKR
jgi:hypothetical protein